MKTNLKQLPALAYLDMAIMTACMYDIPTQQKKTKLKEECLN